MRPPAPIKRAVSGGLNALDPLATRRWRSRTGEDEVPIPPRRLRARVGDPSVGEWVPGGERVARELNGILETHGLPLSSFGSVCDFGCGSGRVLSHLDVAPGATLHGMDVDAEAIDWVRANLPEIDARANPAHGPAPFEDGSFDFLCSISIFTHLNRRSQEIWLAEVARLLAPGGLALLTVLGNELRQTWERGDRPGIAESQRRQLEEMPPLAEAGFLFAPEPRTRWNAWRYRGVEEDYGLAFWSHEAIRKEWSRWFEVLEIVPRSINWKQDAVLLRLSH
jgi:SAM-dependent methyltransferase